MRLRQLWMAAIVLAAMGVGSASMAGVYSGPTDTANAIDPAIPASSPAFVECADAILPLGLGTYFAPRGSAAVSPTGFNCLGDLDATQTANGDPVGYLTVTFPHGVRNGLGFDFAVFENGFTYATTNSLFLELAYVEVSTNGTDFARFPCVSTNTGPVTGTNPFAGFDTSNIWNLAGKHADGYGTPFDLDDLTSDQKVLNGLVNLDNIQYVRLVDIPGNGAYLDSFGNPILDNWMTTGSGGFDFRLPAGKGIGVLNAVPEPTTIVLLLTGLLAAAMRRRRRAD